MNSAHKSTTTRWAALVAGAISVLAIALGTQAFAQTATTTSSGTAFGSTTPLVSMVSVTRADPYNGTADVSWSTDVPSQSTLYWGTSQGNYTNSTSAESGYSTAHAATISGLSPGVTYHLAASANNGSANTGNSVDQVFTMPNLGDGVINPSQAPGTSTPVATNNISAAVTTGTTGLANSSSNVTVGSSSIDIQSLIRQILNDLAILQGELNSLQAQSGATVTGVSGAGIASTTASSTLGTGTITPNNASVRSGTSIDFTGSGFWNNEPVKVMSNGQTIATVTADGAGNFSTGSLPVSASSNGSQTYTFIGSWSGITGSATATVTS